MSINISEKKLKSIIKESVKEAIDSEMVKFRSFVLSNISQKEQEDIEKRYKVPSLKEKYKTLSL
jgi:hypothetical protein